MEEAIQSSIYVATPDYAGWLQKRGFAWRKLWKKRWIAINGAEIAYMDKEPNPENIKTVNVSKATITGSTLVRDDDDPEQNELGFSIHLNDGQQPAWHLRADSVREKKNWMIRIGYVIAIVRWLESFEKVKVLGVGGSGIVYELLHKSNGNSYALKEIEIKSQRQKESAIAEAEMLKDIMEHISHPNILHIEKVFQVGSKFYLVFPLCTGGELYEHIIRRGHFTERDAAIIIRDLISGLHALHQHEILHLDIKPENILFDKMGDDAKIKLTDFGISRVIASGNQRVKAKNANVKDFNVEIFKKKIQDIEDTGDLDITHVKGTIGYMSPELILMNYPSKAADIFAAGIILYILLCGRPPFPGESDRLVLENTAKCKFNQANSRWKAISAEGKDLINKMLAQNPLERISCEGILEHPWIKQVEEISADSEVAKVSQMVDTLVHISAASGSGDLSDSTTAKSTSHAVSGLGARSLSPVPGGSNANDLHDTLKLLTKHVSHLRSQKMATNITRLVSLMQKPEGGKPLASSSGSGKTSSATVGAGGGIADTEAMASLAEIYLKPSQGRTLEPRKSSFAIDPANPDRDLLTDAELADAVSARDEEVLAVLNNDLRDALCNVIAKITSGHSPKPRESFSDNPADGGLDTSRYSFADDASAYGEEVEREPGVTIEQFLILLKHMQYTPEPVGRSSMVGGGAASGNKANVGALLFARFLDRDSDGFITMDDVLTAQAQMMQKGEAFLRMVFRVYIEGLWYPGRQINHMNLVKHTLRASGAPNTSLASEEGPSGKLQKGNSIVVSGSEEFAKDCTVVEPPKFLTARNITSIFEKLGYDTSLATRLFQVLCERLTRMRKAEFLAMTTSSSSLATGASSNNVPFQYAVDEEGNFRTLTHSSNGGSNGGGDQYDSSISLGGSLTPPSSSVSGSVSMGQNSTGGSKVDGRDSGENEEVDSRARTASKAIDDLKEAAKAGDLGQLIKEEDEEEDDAFDEDAGDSQKKTTGQQRMDVNDFIRICRIDDVLIQAIFKRPRHNMSLIVKRAVKLSRESKGKHTPSYYIEQEFLQAFSDIQDEGGLVGSASPLPVPGARLAAAGRTAISAAFGFASKVAQSLKGTGAAGGEEGQQTPQPQQQQPIVHNPTNGGAGDDDEFFDCIEGRATQM